MCLGDRRGQMTTHDIYEVSSQLHPVPEMELELSVLETIHADPSHWPTKLIFNPLLFVF